MSEVIFSKKQIGPLVAKYQINVEANETFKSIIEMFADQINYQIWAIKAVFEANATLADISRIKGWVDANQNEIKNLRKGNVVSYKTKADFKNLEKEMRGLDMIAAVRSTINKFNTAQRDMMRKTILDDVTDGTMAYSPTFKKWFELFKSIERMSMHRKQKLISLASAINDMAFMEKYLKDALVESYDWNKEDMLAFLAYNCKDCTVVFNEGNYVIVEVGSFNSSKALCGQGRTSWCLTRQESYFKSYVKETGVPTHQYFYFNFGLKENDELAHVGFTVQEGRGITNAHSTKNQPMIGGGIEYKGKRVSVNDVLASSNVPMSLYLKLKALTNFKWTINDVREYLGRHKNNFAVCLDDNKRIIVRCLTTQGFNMLSGHTFIPQNSFPINGDNNKTFVLLDLNMKSDDTNALVAISFLRDEYKFDRCVRITNQYNVNLTQKKYLESIGIKTANYLNREKIDPSILLHKFIDEGNEREAINVIVENGDKFDVNFEFNGRKPIFSAIDNKLYGVFEAIINHPMFDSNTCDAYEETLLQSLLYNYKIEGITTAEEDAETKREIDIILKSQNLDFNAQNINYDTAINIACERKDLLWVVEALVANPNVNLNIVNDFNCTALGNAIRKHNVDAIKLLATRNDLIVRDEDMELARNASIDLQALLPTSVFEYSKTAEVQKAESLTSDIYSELFAKAFAELNE